MRKVRRIKEPQEGDGLFDYVGERRGYWAQLAAPNGHRVTLTEHPGTLLSMLRAGVLTGEARRDAEELTP